MSGTSDLTTAILGGGGVTALIALVAKRLPPSKGDVTSRADKLVADALERYQEDNKDLGEQVRQARLEMAEFRDWARERMGELELQHVGDVTQRDTDRKRIYDLEQQVSSLQTELARQTERTIAAEKISSELHRSAASRTRRGDRGRRDEQ